MNKDNRKKTPLTKDKESINCNNALGSEDVKNAHAAGDGAMERNGEDLLTGGEDDKKKAKNDY